jgi:putative hemolysin
MSFTQKSSRICTIFDEERQHGSVNPAQVNPLRSGLLPPAVAGAGFDTRMGARLVQPDWIGCDLRSYRLRLAESAAERAAACRLRFRVFNLELGEGLPESYVNGLDQDAYDAVCEHLLVEEKATGRIIGTYRMQSGMTAWAHLGYYSAQEFDFAAYAELRPQLLELGRACIEREHRTGEVLTLLWRGIAQYAHHHGLRYLIGCSSVPSQDAATGWAMYHRLAPFLAAPHLRTQPVTKCRLPVPASDTAVPETKVPKLLKTYLAVGARICSEPAWDRAFGTIDFLTLQDMHELTPAARSRFLCGP